MNIPSLPFTVLLALAIAGAPILEASAQPTVAIESVKIDQGEVVVEVDVLEAAASITLESRLRIGSGSWEPRAVIRPSPTGTFAFRLPVGEDMEVLRVRHQEEDPLPSSFYAGPTTFPGKAGRDHSDFVIIGPGGGSGAGPLDPDIWEADESTVYFFSQHGLQVFDISSPAEARIDATFPIAATGEYLRLHNEHVFLLVNESCAPDIYIQSSRLIVVKDPTRNPSEAAVIDLNGRIWESALVGDTLYIVSTWNRPIHRQAGDAENGDENASEWEEGVSIVSIDISAPAAPVIRDSLWYPGIMEVVEFSNGSLLLSMPNSTAAPTRRLSTLHPATECLTGSAAFARRAGSMIEIGCMPRTGC